MQLADGINISDVWQWSGGKNGGFSSLAEFASQLVPNLLLIGGIIAFIIAFVAGLGVIMGAGGGDPHATESRQQILTYAIIGLLIMFGAYWLIQIINYLTGGSLSGIGLQK